MMEHINPQSPSSPIPHRGRPEDAAADLEPKRFQEGITFNVDGEIVDREDVALVVDGTVLYAEHMDIGIAPGKLGFETVEMAFDQVAAAFRYAARGRLGKAIGSLRAAMDNARDFVEDVASFFAVRIDVRLTPAGKERLGLLRKLKPERVQAGVTSKLKPEPAFSESSQAGFRFRVNGEAVDNDRIVLLVDGLELLPASVRFGVVISKLKPERVQAGLTLAADAIRFAYRARYRAAVQAFREAMAIVREVVADIASAFGLTVEIVLAEDAEG